MDTPQTTNEEVLRIRRQSAQRKLQKRLRLVRLLWTIVVGLVMLLLLEALIAMTFSPRFWIYRISVLPTETFTQSEIIQLLALPPRSNFYRVPLGKLEARLRHDPRVLSAQVKKGTVGTLLVEIQERQAVCQVGTGTPPLYMDRQGVLFMRPHPPIYPIPLVEGLTLPPPGHVLGRPLTDPTTRVALDTLAQFGKIGDTLLDIAQMDVGSGQLDLRLRQGTLLHIGLIGGIDLRQQARCMDIALTAVRQAGYTLDQIDVIDISHAVVDKGKGILYTPKKAVEATTQP